MERPRPSSVYLATEHHQLEGSRASTSILLTPCLVFQQMNDADLLPVTNLVPFLKTYAVVSLEQVWSPPQSLSSFKGQPESTPPPVPQGASQGLVNNVGDILSGPW